MSDVALHGIPNCDQVKRARAWLQAAGVAYQFHDFKRARPEAARLQRWMAAVGADTLVNRKGTTWRGLSEAERGAAHTPEGALALCLAQPSVIKRPVLESGDRILVGFDPATYESFFR